ncbi:MAG: hypothetical protein H7249_17480 [Chitinophagaceae bacterium]|nr:hypothetical protein [Oligoflexus sp.]
MAKKPWMVLAFLILGSAAKPVPVPSPRVEPIPTLPELALEKPLHASEAMAEFVTREEDIRKLFSEKHYEDALGLIESEVKKLNSGNGSSDYRAWLDRQKWILKTAQAWPLLEKQNCNGAMDILREIPSDKIPAVALKAFGYCKLMAREWPDADTYLTQYIQTQNQDKEAVQMLARVKEYQGLFEEAIDLTHKLEKMPDGGAAPVDLEPIKRSLAAKQDESEKQLMMETGFFRIHYQPNVGPDFIEKVVETLNKTASKLNLDFGIDYPSNVVDIYFHSEERFGEITHSPNWAAGIYDGQIRLPVGQDAVWSEETERSIRHELAHALLSEMVGRRNLPTWFQEGFAQMAECEDLCLHYEYAATTQKFFPIEKFDETFMKMPTREAQVAYKQSFYMMLLLQRHQGVANMKQMFSLIEGLSVLSSADIVEQGAWTFPMLHQYAKQAWEGQLSL